EGDARRYHLAGREELEAGRTRERHEQDHSEPEERDGIEGERQVDVDGVEDAAPLPAGADPDSEPEENGDELGQADQEDGRPDPFSQDVDDRPPLLERIAESERAEVAEVGHELVRRERLGEMADLRARAGPDDIDREDRLGEPELLPDLLSTFLSRVPGQER